MAGTENNAAIAAALQAEESRKRWNPFIRGKKGFNAQNGRVHTVERLLNSPNFKKAYPHMQAILKHPYEAGKFCKTKKSSMFEDCKALKGDYSYSKIPYNSNDKRSIYDLQTNAWKADYERGFALSGLKLAEENNKNGKNFINKYGRTRSKRSLRRVTRKRV
jgi:hypothetical protein